MLLLNGATVRASSDELSVWGFGTPAEQWSKATLKQPWLSKWHRDHVLRVAAFPIVYLPQSLLRQNPWIEDRAEAEAAAGHALCVVNYRILRESLIEQLQRLLARCNATEHAKKAVTLTSDDGGKQRNL